MSVPVPTNDDASVTVVALPGVDAPPESECAVVWDSRIPLPPKSRPPLVWLLAAHGGAGVSTLVQQLALMGDCARQWPSGRFDDESPFVIVVAKETVEGLSAAHYLLRQHACGLAGGSRLVGLVTVAVSDRRPVKEISRLLEVVQSLAPAHWKVGWNKHYASYPIKDLASWSPFDEPVDVKKAKKMPITAHVPVPVIDMCQKIMVDITAMIAIKEESAS